MERLSMKTTVFSLFSILWLVMTSLPLAGAQKQITFWTTEVEKDRLEMNLYKGRLTSKDGRLCFQGSGFSLDLGGLQLGLEEGEVQLGIRPEDIEIEEGGSTVVKAKVDMLSNIGSEKYIHAHLGQEGLTVRVPKEATFQPGQIVPLSIDPDRVHIFQGGRRMPTTSDP
jgi:ABC-type sugar transport system ATPase subunit